MDRRDFLRYLSLLAGAGAAGGLLAGCSQAASPAANAVGGVPTSSPFPTAAGSEIAGKIGRNRFDPSVTGGVDVAVATKADPQTLVKNAVNGLGGIDRFVHKGDMVVIKPNLAWAREPAQAADTSPEVLAAVIALCQQAGAGEILVQEHSCASAAAAFEMSGAKAVCEKLGVQLVSLENQNMFRQVALPKAQGIKQDQIGADILDCDVLINLPICKRHTATECTLGMKNLMGTIWDRQRYHSQASQSSGGDNLHRNIADLAGALRPTLNILEATRALTTEGPQDGIVKQLNTVVAAVDIVALDAYGAKLLGQDPLKVGHIRMASGDGTGNADLGTLKIKQV